MTHAALVDEDGATLARGIGPCCNHHRVGVDSAFAALESLDSGLRLTGHERFEIGLELAREFSIDYVITETDVVHAVELGIPEPGIRAWCSETLSPIFGGNEREVLFDGYIAYMDV